MTARDFKNPLALTPHMYIVLRFQRQQNQGNGQRRHSVPHTHSEWATGAGGYVPVPWVLDYRRW